MNSTTIDLEQELLAVAASLPERRWLDEYEADATKAQERGYYLPDEDERLRRIFGHYLGMRAVLTSVLQFTEPRREDDLRAFAVAFCAAAVLLRAGKYLCEIAAANSVVWSKLDEEDEVHGIPSKSFTQIYRSVSRPRRLWRFHQAWKFYDARKDELLAISQRDGWEAVMQLLEGEELFMDRQRRAHLQRGFAYRLFSLRRRHYSGYRQVMFTLLKMGGNLVSEVRQPTRRLFF